MKESIEISIPRELLEKAKERGVNLDKFKTTVKTFALLDIMARTSKLSKNGTEVLSKRIKAMAWKKIKKDLKM
jgi:hypothetical protein